MTPEQGDTKTSGYTVILQLIAHLTRSRTFLYQTKRAGTHSTNADNAEGEILHRNCQCSFKENRLILLGRGKMLSGKSGMRNSARSCIAMLHVTSRTCHPLASLCPLLLEKPNNRSTPKGVVTGDFFLPLLFLYKSRSSNCHPHQDLHTRPGPTK